MGFLEEARQGFKTSTRERSAELSSLRHCTSHDTPALERGELPIGGGFVVNLILVVLDYTLQFRWDL